MNINRIVVLILLAFLLIPIQMQAKKKKTKAKKETSVQCHIVKKDDNLYSLSKKYKISVDDLKKYNNLKNNNLFPGMKLYFTPAEDKKDEKIAQKSIPSSKYYIVKKGDNLYQLARTFDVEVVDLMEFNNLKSIDLQIGDKLWLEAPKETTEYASGNKIPQATDEEVTGIIVLNEKPVISSTDKNYKAKDDKGAKIEQATSEPEVPETKENKYHVVQKGENLFRISKLYKITIEQLKSLNKLASSNLKAGQRILIGEFSSIHKPEAELVPDKIEPSYIPQLELYMPCKGKILSRFGARRSHRLHKGIDVGAPSGEPIYATLTGKVVYSGYQRGYGNVIILEHQDFIMTVYGHNETNLVRLGDEVTKGQPIATVGATGNATCSHLHFEYRVKGRAIDPLKVLPDTEKNLTPGESDFETQD